MKNALKFVSYPLLLTVAACCDTIECIIEENFNHTPVSPASELYEAGSVFYISDPRTITLDSICQQDQLFGSDYEGISSPTISQEWQEAVSSSFELEASYLDSVNVGLGRQAVKNISMSFSNAEVQIMNGTAIRNDANRDTSLINCLSSVNDQITNGDVVTVVSSALKADVIYTIEFNEMIDADIQAQITERIAAELRFDLDRSVNNRISGQGLIWGVRDNAVMLEAYKDVANQMPTTAAVQVDIGSLLEVAPIETGSDGIVPLTEPDELRFLPSFIVAMPVE